MDTIKDDDISAMLIDWDESELEDNDDDLEEVVSDILSGKKTYNDFIEEKIEEHDPQVTQLFLPHAKVNS